jgi:RNA polymerase sigma factor (TIGR02999 family)
VADTDDITRMLENLEGEQDGAMDRLMDAVYADLERMAERHMSQRFGSGLAGVTLEPAALVNESFLRLIRQRKSYGNRGQFFAIATRIMLRVLVDYQRSRGASKRGGDRRRLTLQLDRDAAGPEDTGPELDVESLVSALQRLEGLDDRKANVVKLRVVWGLPMQEIATALDVSLATAERDWAFAKAWLAREAAEAVDAKPEPP